MEESVQMKYHEELEALISEVVDYSPKANIVLIRKAFDLAFSAHKGQVRESGEEYITHPLAVANILTELKVDSPTIAAALLHDILEKSKVSENELKKTFGVEVTELVNGVTKMDRFHFKSKEEYNAENIRKVVLSMSKDVRVILIKLADRLHNMRTLKFKKDEVRRREISQETMDIFAPIAYKLGIYKLKSELEDLSLKFLNPKIFVDLKKKISNKRVERDREVVKLVSNIQGLMDKQDVKCKVFGRAKHFYSIYKKMLKRKVSFDELSDLLAFRIITTSVDECYRALGIVHATWTPIPSSFDDYIATPKANGYQSIHTEVLFDGKPIEIQIRTADMHHIAEDGIAAHWRYKETEYDKKFDKKIAWLKQILTWKREAKSAKEFVESLKIDLFENEIVVLTPKGDPISLLEGSTPIDFAYYLHTGIGGTCQKAKVNGEIVPLDYKLRSGDLVEIITSNKAKPSRNWLKFAKTTFARAEIRQALHIKGVQLEKDSEIFLKAQEVKVEDSRFKDKLRFSGCCYPKFGEDICAFQLKDGKVSIHTVKCTNISKFKDLKSVRVWWPKLDQPNTTIIIAATDRVGLLAQILNTIADEGVNVASINAEAKKDHHKIIIKLDSESKDQVKGLVNKVKAISNVINVAYEKK